MMRSVSRRILVFTVPSGQADFVCDFGVAVTIKVSEKNEFAVRQGPSAAAIIPESAKGAAARRQGRKEHARSFGGALDTATVLRAFLESKLPACAGPPRPRPTPWSASICRTRAKAKSKKTSRVTRSFQSIAVQVP
jgi:hypothetical protein